MADTIQKPLQWSSAHAKEAISFGITDYKNSYPFFWDDVFNVGGKAEFRNLGVLSTPPCKYLSIDSGIYQGTHVVISIDSNGHVLTATDYIATDYGSDGYCNVNLIYRLYYGYPTPETGLYIDIAPLWKSDGTLIVNLSEYLKSIFTIAPPVPGYDENMYSYFRVQIRGAEDFNDFCTGISEDPLALIETWTDYDWELAANLWYVINGCIPHVEFNNEYTGGTDVLSEETPVVFSNGSIISKIQSNRVYNVFT